MLLTIFISLAISLGLNYFVMIISWIKKTDHYFDFTYGFSFLIITIFSMVFNANYSISMILVLILISFWSIRLSSFLFIRIKQVKNDQRLQAFLESFKKFFILWTIQSLIIWLILFPIYFIAYYNISNNLFYSLILLISLYFLIVETISDLQKFNHKKTNQKGLITTGYWKYSRHINYFAEICFWTFICLFVLLNNFNLISLISLIGPLTIILILYRVSGLPMIENYQNKTYKNDPAYQKYVQNTPCLIPFIGKKGPYKRLK